jgi:hypothetical protein
MDTSVMNFLMADTKSHLEEVLITDVSDSSKVTEIHLGEYQTQPSSVGLVVKVTQGGDEWYHSLNVRGAGDGVFMNVPYEIGSGKFWRRRFIIELALYFPPDIDQDTARTIGNVILYRAESALEIVYPPYWFTTTPDSFGEQASEVQVLRSYIRERGREGLWNQNAILHVEFVTEKIPS